ncbi:MAG: 2-dehydropantoate 2-reductase [Dysgonamonadaceae bacterium]|jgi:2-dehydropantoate 2-reductase|nr:2-dehydropantoate 2-reductase [Dysgonamonadaceae bacterium]
MTNKTKYLVVGTGGVGGSIAGFLALAGKDVTCIARGAHLQAIRERGLILKSDLKGTHYLKIPACTAEEFAGKADVIFVCVKGYSIESIAGLIQRAVHKDTLIIPVLNVYGTGDRIQTMAGSGATALDGCIYIVSFVSAPGEITQMGKIFRLVYGVRKGTVVSPGKIQAVRDDLTESGIKAVISEDINRDTFIKWSFISAMALTGAYFDVPMREIQKSGEERDVFIGLSTESAEVGRKLNIPVPGDLVDYNLRILDSLDPDSTASLQKDIAKGHESEIDDLLFNMIRMGEKAGVEMATYRQIFMRFKPARE